jgi:predicted acyl esterase
VGYEVIYPNGAYLKDLGDIWITSTVPDSAEESLQELYQHEMFDDWWTNLEMTGQYQLVHWPSGFWAGWYDIFLVGNLLAYSGYNDQSDGVNGQSRITVDPLGHCQSAAGYFKPVCDISVVGGVYAFTNAVLFQNLIAGRTAVALFQAYETFGVFDMPRTNIKNVTFYVMSSNDAVGEEAGLYWSSLDKWPVPKMVSMYFLSTCWD